MGTTRSFYFIKNRNFSKKDITEALNHFKSVKEEFVMQEKLQIYYHEALKWLPVFSEDLAWQAEEMPEEFIERLGKEFCTEVIALSVMDSDVTFLKTYENGMIQKFICADEFIVNEFGFEDYSTKFPVVLDKMGLNPFHVRKIWNPEKYFDEVDLLYDMFGLMETFPVFEEDDESVRGIVKERDIEIIEIY